MAPDELRARRKALGYTQGQLAELLGVHRVTVGKWEGGQIAIEHPKMLSLALSTLERQPRRRKTTAQ